jgi:hypothetical protein
MFVRDEELFNNNVFVLNDSPQIETIQTDVAELIIIDDFYKDMDSVLGEIDKLPFTKVFPHYSGNGDTFFDTRKVYTNNMTGSEIPYTIDNSLRDGVGELIDYPKESIEVLGDLLINCFQFTDKFPLDDSKYYSVHRDAPDHVAMVVFLNKHYEEGEGMNFYRETEYNRSTDNRFTLREDIDIIHTVQGKCNRAVLFDTMFKHGQHTPTDQFKKEMRYTQAIFLKLH